MGCIVSCGCLLWHLWCSGACFAGSLWLRFSFFRVGLPLVFLWLGVGVLGGWEFPLAWGGGRGGRRGLSVPRLPRASRKRAGFPCFCSLPGLPPQFDFLSRTSRPPSPAGATPKSEGAVVDTEEDRSACPVIPKLGAVTLLRCHKPGANLHQPGIEPGSHRWQRCILPLDH